MGKRLIFLGLSKFIYSHGCMRHTTGTVRWPSNPRLLPDYSRHFRGKRTPVPGLLPFASCRTRYSVGQPRLVQPLSQCDAQR